MKISGWSHLLCGISLWGFVFLSPVLASAAPTIFYTDIVAGPNVGGENNSGTYLSIFGTGFGSSQRASRVYVNDVEIAAYKYWGPSKGRPDIQQISVQPGPSVWSGALPSLPLQIRVVVNGVDSNTDHAFTVISGDIYFVALNGSDSTGVIGDITAPFRSAETTFNRGDFGPGDTIVVRGGTWQESALFLLMSNGKNGTPEAPMAVLGYPGETVLIQGAGCEIRMNTGGNYTTVAGLHQDCQGLGGALSARTPAIGFRYVNNEAKERHSTGGGSGMVAGRFSRLSKILGNAVHEVGDNKLYHGIYVSADETDLLEDVEIAYNHVYNVNYFAAGSNEGSGRGIQIFGGSGSLGLGFRNFSIHDNLIHDIHRHAISMGVGTQAGFKVYNNIVYRTGLAEQGGIRPNSTTLVAEIYNNTLYGNNIGLHLEDATGLTIRNNVVYALTGQSYVSSPGGFSTSVITDSHNLFFGVGPVPSWADPATSINADPKLINPTAGDFHLQPDSPARDAGIDAGVRMDHEGTLRPQGVASDIGAFEYVVRELTAPSEPTGLAVQ